jgi:hypothetical protein
MKDIPICFQRFYHLRPEQKTLKMCFNHGVDHASYRWSKQIDPRWSFAQIRAYLKGYKGKKF